MYWNKEYYIWLILEVHTSSGDHLLLRAIKDMNDGPQEKQLSQRLAQEKKKKTTCFYFLQKILFKASSQAIKILRQTFPFQFDFDEWFRAMVYAKPARLRFSICQTEPKKLQLLGRQCNAMQWISVVWHQQPKEWNCINNGGRRRRWGGSSSSLKRSWRVIGCLSRPAL